MFTVSVVFAFIKNFTGVPMLIKEIYDDMYSQLPDIIIIELFEIKYLASPLIMILRLYVLKLLNEPHHIVQLDHHSFPGSTASLTAVVQSEKAGAVLYGATRFG
ncbi:hypothetical protein [Paenibacillus uliginis]|uniref:hypothetical protein n=1 Tax=Paenibacillus uliginis TaxID=683737 RepID=UPI001AD836AA|nr:hypothetical protein [Paenibacillus uliginis]